MQINIHIPRSEIRAGIKSNYDYFPFDVALTNALGTPAYLGMTTVVMPDIGETIKAPRSVSRALFHYDMRRLDAPVRFRLTIPDEVKA